MHLSQVDLNLFVVLEAIYREGNITRAGHQLNLTQPAISHALKRLRDLLQDPLFVRKGPHMVPTPFTRNMIEEVRQAFRFWRRISAKAAISFPSTRGALFKCRSGNMPRR